MGDCESFVVKNYIIKQDYIHVKCTGSPVYGALSSGIFLSPGGKLMQLVWGIQSFKLHTAVKKFILVRFPVGLCLNKR